MNSSRISWIDYGKCICMLMVILSHTYTYYTGSGNLFLDLMKPTRLVVFFFISGYLIKLDSFNFKKMMTSIFKKLLFPYFIFTSIIWLPKNLAHGSGINFENFIIDIFGGYASWFVAALAVSKITLSFILKYTRSLKTIWVLCVLFFFLGLGMAQFLDIKIPWYAHNGFIALIYIAVGMTYRKYESVLSRHINKQVLLSVLLYFAFVSIDHFIVKESTYIFGLRYNNVSLTGVFSFLFLSLVGIWMMISIVKILPSDISWMTYIGKNSLTYYYLNTGILTLLIILLRKFGYAYSGNDYITIFLYIVTILLLTMISKLIMHYAPWMVGNFKSSSKV